MLWAFLTTCALAQGGGPIELELRVYPPDAQVFRVEAGVRDENQDGLPDYEIIPRVGDSDQHCIIELKPEEAANPFAFTFRRPGFLFQPVYEWTPSLPTENDPATDRPRYVKEYPTDLEGEIVGKAENLWVKASTWMKFHPKTVAATTFLFFSLGWLLVRTRKERLLVQTHTRKRESLTAHLDTTDPLVGKTLGGYLVLDRLGEGGMATVYKAVPEESLDTREVSAIKVMQKKLAEDEDFRKRFQREVKVSRDLNHPNIVRVDDFGEHGEDKILYLVMEYIPGETLERKFPRNGWSLPEAMPYLEPIMEALIYAHERKVVHRDLKPENIMVAHSGAVKVMDFGLARSQDVTKVTKTGSAMGTPAYMPPEQINGAAPAPAADQYAFGVMVYELLTGRRPFEEDDLYATLMKHMSARPPSPREYKPGISAELEQLILRMLEKDPSRRFPSMEVVREGLLAIASGRPWTAPPLPKLPERKAPAPLPNANESAAIEGPGGGTVEAPFDPSPDISSDGTIGFQALPINAPEGDGTIGFQALPAAAKDQSELGPPK